MIGVCDDVPLGANSARIPVNIHASWDNEVARTDGRWTSLRHETFDELGRTRWETGGE